MSFIGQNPKWKTGGFKPQSTDPANPQEGDVFRSDGTTRRKGLLEYNGSAWIPLIPSPSKNYILNGNMDIRQRCTNIGGNQTKTLSTTPGYGVTDRYLHSLIGGSATGTMTFDNSTVPNNLSLYTMKYTTNMSATTDKVVTAQRIESIYAQDMASLKASLSFYIKPQSARKVDIELYYADVKDDFSAVTSFASQLNTVVVDNDTWQLVKFENISMHANSSNGVEVRLRYHDFSTTGSNRTTYITQLKLNLGPVADTFTYFAGSKVAERVECQRYFFSQGETNSFAGSHAALANGTTQIRATVFVPTRMRTDPVGSFSYTTSIAAIETNTQSRITLSGTIVGIGTGMPNSDSNSMSLNLGIVGASNNNAYVLETVGIFLDAEL